MAWAAIQMSLLGIGRPFRRSAAAILANPSHVKNVTGKQRDVCVVKKLFEISSILVVMPAVAEAEKQFTDDNCRHQDVVRLPHPAGDTFISSKERGIGVRVEQDLHFHRFLSTTSQAAMLSRSRRSSAFDQRPMKGSSASPIAVAGALASIRPAPRLSRICAALFSDTPSRRANSFNRRSSS